MGSSEREVHPFPWKIGHILSDRGVCHHGIPEKRVNICSDILEALKALGAPGLSFSVSIKMRQVGFTILIYYDARSTKHCLV
jgi:hypothetical protein